ncbi:unnamed protein product [Eruca vesicaria subsp. sativa]|uniref:Endoglucanase n=1 Tax=Eruca vesicaria subsp. sativa TaxID=29727 RepID=A0ABC8JW38_ERUVS|nr:unnamed protein product [Eruca vesicaria subsp. sativa]
MKPSILTLTVFVLLLLLPTVIPHDYSDALHKSILFFEGQRSGRLPRQQRMSWRGDSGLKDGENLNTDLVGGYHDAGDNVKFHFPMAFTATMLAWSSVDFGCYMSEKHHKDNLVALKWATNYLLKTVSQLPHRIFVQVGEAQPDHDCWERPEDMDTPRTAFAIDAPGPASDLAGEIAAALAAASIAFKQSNPTYSRLLLNKAIQTFQYADMHRGSYADSPNGHKAACPFYCSANGYKDELLWGAAWLRRATGSDDYLEYLVKNRESFGVDYNYMDFGWDSKFVGIDVLVAKEMFEKNVSGLTPYKDMAEKMMCTLFPETAGPHLNYTPAGLLSNTVGCQLQSAAALSFLILKYADYLSKFSQQLTCGNLKFQPDSLRRIAKRQVDYILGDNPMHLSYMVGYGDQYPRQIHHRGSSIPSIKVQRTAPGCLQGWDIFHSDKPNPNILVGAVVGGPNVDDSFIGKRTNATDTEPTTYTNAPLVGVLAYFSSNPNFH